MELRWSPAAVDDLDRLYESLERDYPAAVRSVMSNLLSVLERIERFPESSPVGPVLADGRRYRVAVAGDQLVYYRIDEELLLIARIWPARRARLP